VFGVSSDEYLNYAEQNLAEWKAKGEQVVAEMVRAVREEYGESYNDEPEFVDEPIDESEAPEPEMAPVSTRRLPEELDESEQDEGAPSEEKPLLSVMDASAFSV
jgi:hypothetical protein